MFSKKLYSYFAVSGALALVPQFALAANGPSFIPSAVINLAAGTATLPLQEGTLTNGTRFWFIFTDASTQAVAKNQGLAFSPSLGVAAKLAGTRHVHREHDGSFVFDRGTVDFSPVRQLVPGDAPNFFPPKSTTPGSVATGDYSPLALLDDAAGTVYNAPIVALGLGLNELLLADGTPDYSRVHDKVVSIDTKNFTVTLKLTRGFTDGHYVVYMSFDSNVGLAATMEAATLVPADGEFLGSGAELDLYALANGETGTKNPNRQGFNSALAGDGAPLNILTLPANGTVYSPLWDLNLGVWSNAAISGGLRRRLTSEAEIQSASSAGLVSSPNGAPLGSTGIVVNCPVLQVLGVPSAPKVK